MKIKKTAGIAAVLMLGGVTALGVFRYLSAQTTAPPTSGSKIAAARLQAKIDAIDKAHADRGRKERQKVEVTEIELESYVMVVLRPEIPVPIDSIKIRLTPGTISAEARMTFATNVTGNVLYDLLISGSHTLLLKGALSGTGGMGKFNLQDTRLDGVPLPRALVDLLIKKYAKPKYPDVDLNKPFKLPYGIKAIVIENGKASIEY